MRIEFVECKSRATAEKKCPWACKIMACEGGFRCYESMTDYQTAKKQK